MRQEKHTHPMMEKKLGLDSDHVIIDRDTFDLLATKEAEKKCFYCGSNEHNAKYHASTPPEYKMTVICGMCGTGFKLGDNCPKCNSTPSKEDKPTDIGESGSTKAQLAGPKPTEDKPECKHKRRFTGTETCYDCGKYLPDLNKSKPVEIEEICMANYKGRRDTAIEIMIENKLNEAISHITALEERLR